MSGVVVRNKKPAFAVPSMAEIAKIPFGGITVISTFSGCGGSSLGYNLAGCKVLWANEFVESAREVYRANFPDTILDDRDIRDVRPEDIFEATGLAKGELDILDGSPPCASFSMVGKRSAGWGEEHEYSETKQRVDDLFFEFARLVKGTQPKAFVAENVAGLVRGRAVGYFKEIFRALVKAGYRVEAKILDAQFLGVPQSRKRVFFIGMRNDLKRNPEFPKPLPHVYSLGDAIDLNASQYRRTYSECDITDYAIGREWRSLRPGEWSAKYFSLVKAHPNKPSPAITQTAGKVGAAGVVHPFECRKFTIAELRRICAFPDDFILTGAYTQQWERLGRAVPPPVMAAVARSVSATLLRS